MFRALGQDQDLAALREGIAHLGGDGLGPGLIVGEMSEHVLDAGILLGGKQPRTLSLIWLKNNEVPWSWDDQERLFGRMDGFDSAPVAGVDGEPPRASG